MPPQLRMVLLALVLGALPAAAAHASPGSASVEAASGSSDKGAVDEGAASEESAEEEGAEEEGGFWGFVDTVNGYYPFILDDDLEPEVQDRLILFWVVSAACGQVCGPLWIPMLVVGEYPGDGYFVKEALWAIAIAFVTDLVGGVGSAAYGLGSIIILANVVYFTPISIINTYDRALKEERKRTALLKDDDAEAPAAEPDDAKKKKEKKKKRRRRKKKKEARGPLPFGPAPVHVAMAY